jgi:5'-methylthioadenosine phosphorylase
MCYVNISLITDYDVGIEGSDPVSHQSVFDVLKSNNERVTSAIFNIVRAMPAERTCSCGSTLANSRL